MIFDVIERYHAPYVYVEKWRVKDFQLHFHTDIELSLVLSGSADFSVNHQNFTLHAGDIMLINRVTPHSITNPDACECIWLAINPSFCHSFFPSLSSVRFQENFIGAAHPLNAALSADWLMGTNSFSRISISSKGLPGRKVQFLQSSPVWSWIM